MVALPVSLFGSDLELENKKLWHAVSGAAFLKINFNIQDEDILNAVRFHTTGRAGMSLLEKVVFVADMISDDRTFEEADKVRKIADESLDKAVCLSSVLSIDFLIKKLVKISPSTLDAYNDTVGSFDF